MQVTPQAALASRTVSWNPVNFERAAAEWLSEAEKSRSPASRGSRNSQADIAPGLSNALLHNGMLYATVVGCLSCGNLCGDVMHGRLLSNAKCMCHLSVLLSCTHTLQAGGLMALHDVCFFLPLPQLYPQTAPPDPPPLLPSYPLP